MKIYNTLTRKKVIFNPIKKDNVGIYVCGVTIYDRLHLGHARTFTSFDMIVRYLRTLANVKYVRNITDIDDKIITRAKEQGTTAIALTSHFTQLMHDDFNALNLIAPDVEPKVSEHIPEIIDFINILLSKGFAYKDDSGDILFNIKKFEAYGKLSNQNPEMNGSKFNERDLISKQVKSNEHDFVLWKITNDEGFNFPSPFGVGRPGWHIECSAMSKKHLGANFDIHGGGSDLQFPHHENELSQSEAANGVPYANVWMHTGMITVDGVKMSKSLGNFITIEDLLKNHDAEVIKLFLLSSHYRSNMDYSEENILQSEKALERIYRALKDSGGKRSDWVDDGLILKFKEAMSDDFNTPLAISIIHDAVKKLNKESDIFAIDALYSSIFIMGNSIGLFNDSVDDYFTKKEDVNLKHQDIIAARQTARDNKDWDEADRLRDILNKMGVSSNDKKL
jgi:cysteinyl-tRNA synthetase